MQTAKWFDRKFDFTDNNDWGAVVARLAATEQRLKKFFENVPEEKLIVKPEAKWSAKEHAGHLALLEPLWRTRIGDIREQKPVLTPADLENKATSAAGFNNYPAEELISLFTKERHETLLMLAGIPEKDKIKTGFHPRLNQPMRIADLAYFVAEHDDHHLGSMASVIR